MPYDGDIKELSTMETLGMREESNTMRENDNTS
jgi:hypothetical protein